MQKYRGRMKEMFIINGHNIYPNDLLLLIQQKIPAHPAFGSTEYGK